MQVILLVFVGFLLLGVGLGDFSHHINEHLEGRTDWHGAHRGDGVVSSVDEVLFLLD